MHTNQELLVELNDYAVEGRYAVMHEELDNIKEIFTSVTDMVNEAEKIINEE